jgi:hypothetical protein
MTMTELKKTATRTPEAARAALDVMLTDAAVGGPSRMIGPGAAASLTAGLARHPSRAVRRVGGLGSELVRVAAGRSEIAPAKRDRRSPIRPGSQAGCSGGCFRPTSRSTTQSTA